MSNNEIEQVTEIELDAKDVGSLEGIRNFTELAMLNCDANHLTELDLHYNTKLTQLFCYDNQLTSLNVSGCTELAMLNCDANHLTELDLHYNTKLMELYCSENQLTSLNVSGCRNLVILTCTNNQLTTLDLSACTNLQFIECQCNKINGSGAKTFINKLPSVSEPRSLCFKDSRIEPDGNMLTPAQVSAARVKNWNPCEIIIGTHIAERVNYEGEDYSARFFIDDFSLAVGETKEVAIKLTSNIANVCMFQVQIKASGGLEFADSGDVKLLNEAVTPEWTVTEDNELRIVGNAGYSTIWNAMVDTPVLTFKVKGVAEGQQSLQFTRMIVVYDGYSGTYTAPAASTTVTVTAAPEAKRGDLNGDGSVDVSDVSLLIDFVLGKPVELADGAECDLDGDGNTDVSDVSLLIDIVLGRDVPEPTAQTITVNGVSFKMIKVKGGTFTMGATSEQGSDYDSDELPTHQVTLSDYSIGETEVTQELWQAVMGANPSNFTGNLQRPVERVSWTDCQTFITKLNQLTGKNFRLPTEAEWEYAPRGGNKSQGYKYSGSNTIGDVAWYDSNSSRSTHPVASKSPNELGLYDMSGNVWELCQDWYGSYSSDAQTNPTGPEVGANRIRRGGSWDGNARDCRVTYRNNEGPDTGWYYTGLRLAM